MIQYVAFEMTNGDYIAHYGVKGQKWGRRRYQNSDGTLINPKGRNTSLRKSQNRAMTRAGVAGAAAGGAAAYAGYHLAKGTAKVVASRKAKNSLKTALRSAAAGNYKRAAIAGLAAAGLTAGTVIAAKRYKKKVKQQYSQQRR